MQKQFLTKLAILINFRTNFPTYQQSNVFNIVCNFPIQSLHVFFSIRPSKSFVFFFSFLQTAGKERPSVFTELFPNASFPSVQSLLSIQHGRRNIRKSSFSLAENRSEETSFLFKANRIKTKRCFKAKLYHDVGVRPSCQ